MLGSGAFLVAVAVVSGVIVRWITEGDKGSNSGSIDSANAGANADAARTRSESGEQRGDVSDKRAPLDKDSEKGGDEAGESPVNIDRISEEVVNELRDRGSDIADAARNKGKETLDDGTKAIVDFIQEKAKDAEGKHEEMRFSIPRSKAREEAMERVIEVVLSAELEDAVKNGEMSLDEAVTRQTKGEPEYLDIEGW